jgi:hypothetical protein
LEFIAKTVQGFVCQASNPVPKSQNFIFFPELASLMFNFKVRIVLTWSNGNCGSNNDNKIWYTHILVPMVRVSLVSLLNMRKKNKACRVEKSSSPSNEHNISRS